MVYTLWHFQHSLGDVSVTIVVCDGQVREADVHRRQHMDTKGGTNSSELRCAIDFTCQLSTDSSLFLTDLITYTRFHSFYNSEGRAAAWSSSGRRPGRRRARGQ